MLKDGEDLGAPEVTTLSGRRTVMLSTEMTTVVTGLVAHDDRTNRDGTLANNALEPQTTNIECGLVLDLVPRVLADGYTLNLTAVPALTEFGGYTPTNGSLPRYVPQIRTQKINADVHLWDGQTLVLQGLKKFTSNKKPIVGDIPSLPVFAKENKEVLVFITVSIVDPAGNRVHTDDDMPFAQESVPSQPKPVFKPGGTSQY